MGTKLIFHKKNRLQILQINYYFLINDSVSHMLAGMYPPTNEQVWNKSLLWQAIPIHTEPRTSDYVLGDRRPCPKYNQAFEEYQQSNEVLLTLKNNKTLIEYLEKYTGANISTICQVKTIYQTLWVENLKNFTLPAWTDKVFYAGSDMEKMAKFCFKMRTNTKWLARLTSGFLLKDILDRFSEKKSEKMSPDRSLYIYSAHDSTIANVGRSFILQNQYELKNFSIVLDAEYIGRV